MRRRPNPQEEKAAAIEALVESGVTDELLRAFWTSWPGSTVEYSSMRAFWAFVRERVGRDSRAVKARLALRVDPGLSLRELHVDPGKWWMVRVAHRRLGP